jgi:hypothetical protein
MSTERQSQNLRNVSRRSFYSEMLNDKLSVLANLWHYTASLTRSPLIPTPQVPSKEGKKTNDNALQFYKSSPERRNLF